jgi:hypothetical protein
MGCEDGLISVLNFGFYYMIFIYDNVQHYLTYFKWKSMLTVKCCNTKVATKFNSLPRILSHVLATRKNAELFVYKLKYK